MRAAIVSWTPQEVKKFFKAAGLKAARERPDVVIAFGGEGTLLWSEMLYPGAPKLLLLHQRTCRKKHDLLPILKQLARGDYDIEKLPKLEGRTKRGKLVGMNEVYLQFKPPTALRFSVSINGKLFAKNIIGDGLIVATPYGSTGYFNSITRKRFRRGLGLALNNCVQRVGPWFLPENAKISVKVGRGPGWMVADTNRKLIPVNTGDFVKIGKAKQPARIIHLRGLPLKICNCK